MALQGNFQTNQGFAAANAYARIVRVRGDMNSVTLSVIVHYDVLARNSGAAELHRKDYIIDVSSGMTMNNAGGETNLIAWGYNKLKNDADFSGWTDV